MTTRFLTDKSLIGEGRFAGFFAGDLSFSEPGVGPSWPPDRDCSIRHIALDLHINPLTRSYAGEALLTVEGRAPVSADPGAPTPGIPTTTWSFDLEDLDVSAVELVELGAAPRPLPFRVRRGALIVDAPGPSATLRVVFSGSPRVGIYFVDAPGQRTCAWTQCQDTHGRFLFPCHDHPASRSSFDVQVRAPKGYTVVGNGRLVGEHADEDGNTVRWVWAQAEPIPVYLFTLVIMDAVVVEDPGSVPIRYLAPLGTPEAQLRRVFGNTPAMVRFLEGHFGAYPWPRYDQVVVPEFVFGGMENAGATTLIDLVLTDTRVALDWDAEDLIVHELAHQWFGDLVTCEDWSQAWLNESWATLIESWWFHHSRGADAGEWCRFEQWSQYLEEQSSRYRRPIVTALFRDPIDLFDRHLYEKGAIILHMLSCQLGEAAFVRGVRRYLAGHRLTGVHTRDFQRALEAETGRSLEGFFDQHVLRAGHPVLEIRLGANDDELVVRVKQTQSGDGVPEVYRLDLPVRIDGVAHTLRLRERDQTFYLPTSTAPRLVEVDPASQLAAEILLTGSDRELLIVALHQGSGPAARVRAARALAQEPHPAAWAALRKALRDDPWWGVRAEVADLLANEPDSAGITALIAAIADPSPRARRAIARALGHTRAPEAAAALATWPDEPSLLVEGEVLKALGEARAPDAKTRARARLGEAGWLGLPATRALEALGALRDPEVLPDLLAATATDRPTRVRAAAAAALGRLAQELPGTRLAAIERLSELSADPLFRVQIAAVNALSATGDPRAEPALRQAQVLRPDGRVRRMAYEGLRRIAAGKLPEEAVSGLRRQVEALAESGRQLRDRLARLEGGA